MMWMNGMEVPDIALASHTHAHLVQAFIDELILGEPGLRERRLMLHTQPALPCHRPGSAGEEWGRWCLELRRFTATHGRMPQRVGPLDAKAALEMALYAWAREQKSATGRRKPGASQLDALAQVPGWQTPRGAGPREARWAERLAAAMAFVEAKGRFPSYSRAETDFERSLATWVEYQRDGYRQGRLEAGRVQQLDARLPSWRPSPGRARSTRWRE